MGNAAAFLMSDLAAGITGEITYVDAGFNTIVGGTDVGAALREVARVSDER